MLVGAITLGGTLAAVKAGHYVGVRETMKMRDEEIEEERRREREEEATWNQTRQPKTEPPLRHFTHTCPLAAVKYSASCLGSKCYVCDQPFASGWAYHCSICNCYLHEVCAKDLVALSTCSYSRVQEIRSPADQTTMSTFAHKKHHVKSMYSNVEYKCKHCCTTGYGKRFRCDDCKVDLHPICATCPTKISSFMHPHHDLELKTRRHYSVCAICNNKTKSNIRMYRCKACKFFVHPACSELPQHLMHDLHPVPHPLQLKPAERSRRCDAKCRSDCESGQWCYECKICNISIHIKCILQHSIHGETNKKELLSRVQQIVEVTGGVIDIANVCQNVTF